MALSASLSQIPVNGFSQAGIEIHFCLEPESFLGPGGIQTAVGLAVRLCCIPYNPTGKAGQFPDFLGEIPD